MSHWVVFLSFVSVIFAADTLIHVVYAFAALKLFDRRPFFAVEPPPPHALMWDPVRFPTRDGLELTGGIYLPEKSPCGVIVFCPETAGTYETVTNYAQSLVNAGFAVLSFNFRNESTSDTMPGYQSTHWMTNHEVTDVLSAIDLVESLPQFFGLPIGLMGVSRGASVALVAGARNSHVRAIWAQGAFSTQALSVHHSLTMVRAVVGPLGRFVPTWHIRVTVWCMLQIASLRYGAKFVKLESFLPQWSDRPVQFVCGRADSYVPPSLTRRLAKLIPRVGENSLWVVPKAKHNRERFALPEEYDQRLVTFFQQIQSAETTITPTHRKSVTIEHAIAAAR